MFNLELSNQLEVAVFEKLDFSKCTDQDDKIRIAKQRDIFLSC